MSTELTIGNVPMNAQLFLANANKIRSEMKKLIVGLDEVINLCIIGLGCDGHVSLVDVPGAGKTTLAEALCACIKDGHWAFVQGTADMLPSELIGSNILDLETRKMKWSWGYIKPASQPNATNILLADEVNRMPPKTQSALLGAMQGRKLGENGKLVPLADPFFTIATSNPVEQEGTYSMAEAMLDRFFGQIIPGELSTPDEEELLKRSATYARNQAEAAKIVPCVTPADIIAMRTYSQEHINVSDAVYSYIVRLVRATRPAALEHHYLPESLRKYVVMGAGRRGGIWLAASAKAHAALRGSDTVEFEDVQCMAPYVIRHRLTLRADVALDPQRKTDALIAKALVDNVPTVGEVLKPRRSAADQTEDATEELFDVAKKPSWKFWQRG